MCLNPKPSSVSGPGPGPGPNPNPVTGGEAELGARDRRKQALAQELAGMLSNGDRDARVQAAWDVRRLARSSAKTRSIFGMDAVLQPLVAMLPSPDPDTREPALLALLNLAVRNERNKDNIVKSGALPHLVELLRSENSTLRELATAAVLTLSASTSNKSTIAISGAVPLLVQILISGSIQGKVDAVTTLYNISTSKESSILTLSVGAVEPLLILLKDCKKYSKLAEKATALLHILSRLGEARCMISEMDTGILVLVETVEEGSLLSAEHAVGVLLSLCRSNRMKYRELILKEGAIPGLLLLTVEGTMKAQERARELLDLLRDHSRLMSGSKDSIVFDITSRADCHNKSVENAKRILQDMVRQNKELTFTRMQIRAASCTPKRALAHLKD